MARPIRPFHFPPLGANVAAKKKAKKKSSRSASQRRQLADRREAKRLRGAIRRREEMDGLPQAANQEPTISNPITWLIMAPKRLYNWVLSFADSPHSERALFGLSFAESSFFPVPPDVLLIPLVLGNPQKWVRFATYCTIASVLGGAFGFALGYSVWHGIADTVYAWHLLSVNPANFEKVAGLFADYGVWFILLAAFTPIPYKVITISAGLVAVSPQIPNPLGYFLMFLVVSFIGRGGRFYLVSAMCKRFGPPVLPFIDRHFGWLSLVFGLLLVGGFYVLKLMH